MQKRWWFSFLPLDKDSIKCYENGVKYENDEEVPSNDPCKSCHCYSGEVLCSIEDCAFPGGPGMKCKKKIDKVDNLKAQALLDSMEYNF